MLILSALLSAQSMAQRSAPWVGDTFDGGSCRGQGQGFGPFDYLGRGALADKLELVERYHFTTDMEQLRGRSRDLLANLDYTLRAWPNHHRALNAMIRHQLSLDSNQRFMLRDLDIPPVECYLQRATNFSPNDDMAYMLMGLLSHRQGYNERADAAYKRAVDLAPHNLQAKYNYGLFLLDMGKNNEAKKYADAVYAAGFPLQGLKKRLAEEE
ncbi:hypothetical protein [Chromatocurvus halotolerans]|uniref:hypothetical protein n=1 Tax=Chromatocurvus halotolerans TaxID=1132028 RepID=UPI0013C36D8F|nr:hypothetical protein [Chromatocurvus halotolerans]